MIPNHPLRYALSNELHARPFPEIAAPGRGAYIAIKRNPSSTNQYQADDREHLITLLDRFGAAHPQPNATHYSSSLGLYTLRWESHTEFITYTLLTSGVAESPFDASTFAAFPADWLALIPGECITSALFRIELCEDESYVIDKSSQWFVPESLAISRVLDGQLTIASDFRIDGSGHMRFAVFAQSAAGDRRIGRLVQYLFEIETYKSMAMLGFSSARELNSDLADMDNALTAIASDIRETQKPEELLKTILGVAADIEDLLARYSYRFGASAAYESIVFQRINALREERYEGLQTFGEFMTRRFDPAMRTVASTKDRLEQMAQRLQRASDLMRTRVDVERSAQNQELLESMDKRSGLQLRLQSTVEGLSVVAISYYTVSLASYFFGPLQTYYGISKSLVSAAVTPIVVIVVWLVIRRIKNQHFR